MKNLLEHTRRPDISFHRNGTIRIAARVARMLSLSPGDSINITISDGEVLLHAVHRSHSTGRYEAQCYSSKKGSLNFCANSVRLCRAFMNALGVSTERLAFPVGEPVIIHGVTYVPIITRLMPGQFIPFNTLSTSHD